ncbi:hypothetical protein [Clostridium algidicarnis]|uniref:Uncharacterized protein n=1 Tax=Clostridium algidicarnis TaxID=37659 RepID=A0ABS6C590_9CLOT|nr:hypothetical protein [Clostridium algidicarnis]MBU3220648.1 hypothetical protein [Clostridium algidicarnis]
MINILTLLEKLEQAVKNKDINSPFTTEDLKKWIKTCAIINDDTISNYSDKYIEGFLSSSTIGSTATKTDEKLRKLGTKPESYEF